MDIEARSNKRVPLNLRALCHVSPIERISRMITVHEPMRQREVLISLPRLRWLEEQQ